jgi:uncharacterized protein YceH (UPF0502 family)
MHELTPIQVRVLGCLIEKKETTPDQYPLSLNAVRNACNQKTARHPVTAYTEGEVGHTLRELESMGMVREAWGARVPRYEHCAGKALGQSSKGLAVLAPLLLRGPQTAGEIRTNAQRLYDFDGLEDVQFMLGRLAGLETPLVTALPRQPGHKEERYVHLLSGEPEVPLQASPPAATGSLAERVNELESAVEILAARLSALEPESGDS